MPGNDDTRLLDSLPDRITPRPDEETLKHSVSQSIEDALARLKPREAEILRLYFGLDSDEDMTLEQIGCRLGITRERVRQVRDRALRRMRKVLPEYALSA
jgi:RNA polymerase primary sigma factor